ncbi:ribonuclease HII [Neomicrococcus lactis]|uniref:ribonuclease HII n=1 Tax=Neomicrococcus lactis TaxID=732241 RepID=UPI00230014F8|nr:ribonuclease HII [Neomicrococcus lactis]
MTGAAKPSLRVERTWGREGVDLVIGCDEVGRGAIAGPVSVGMVAVKPLAAKSLPGIRDSKLMTRSAREHMYDIAASWGLASATGSATAAEVDELGIMEALRLAGLRALTGLSENPEFTELVLSSRVRILLDGSFNWLTPGPRQASLFDLDFSEDDDDAERPDAVLRERGIIFEDLEVTVRPKADRDCTSVAVASVIAKVERDAFMRELAVAHPEYGWDSNVGYGSGAHYAGIESSGVTPYHRVSWLKNVGTVQKEDS